MASILAGDQAGALLQNGFNPRAQEDDRRPLLSGASPSSSDFAGRGSGGGGATQPAALEVEDGRLHRAPGSHGDGASQRDGGAAMSSRRRLYMLSIFCTTAALLFADQNLMAPNLTEIAESFGFDYDERDKYLGGYVAAAFYLVGAPSALLFGYLSDKVNRRNLLFVAVLIGEGPCVLTYFVTQYWQLLLLRLLTGISLGGAFPLVFSLLGDMFEPSKRAAVSAVVQIATGAGMAVGQAVAGFTGPAIGWRWPFVIVAIPAIGVAVLMMLTTEDPGRGVSEPALRERLDQDDGFEYQERITWSKLGVLLRTPTNALIIAQGLPGCLPWGMLLTFFTDYLAQNKGLSVATATTVVLVIGVGGAVGVICGGLLSQWLYNRHKWAMPLFNGSCTIAGALPLLYIINADVKAHFPLAMAMGILCGVLSSVMGPGMRAMVMNVNEPETRGMALALQSLLDDLGKGLGPALVAVIISQVGRTAAFNLATAGWIPCGLLVMVCSLTLQRDEAAMQARLQRCMRQMTLASSVHSSGLDLAGEVQLGALDPGAALPDKLVPFLSLEAHKGGSTGGKAGSRPPSDAWPDT